jgi:hypothetical protein
MDDGTWSKAYCFVFITCTMGSVGVYIGGSQQADRWIHVCRGGESAGVNHAGQADAREGGEGPRPFVLCFTEGLGREGEGLIRQEKAVEEEEVGESHTGRFGR